MIWARSYTGIVLFIRYLSNVLYVYFFNEWHEIMRLKSKLYCNVMTSPEFTFHNPCVILELLLSIVIYWRTALSCWRKNYSNKATMFKRTTLSLKDLVVLIMILLTRYQISISQMTMNIFLFTYIYLSIITAKTFTGLDNMSNK